MKKAYLLLAVLALFSCTNDKRQTVVKTDTVTITKTDTVFKNHPSAGVSSAPAKQRLVGQWKEHWGVGVETNVKSNDVYQIMLSDDGDLSISTSDKKKYKIDRLLFDGQELSFRKQNKLYPLGRFYIYYKLKLRDDFLWMEGPIINSKKQKDYVKWEKI
ncbi:MAG: hypothetical protein EOP42_28010 [Sphingobacteriaceae bacterium]|nr:MAG: hypothetical protein EOP42_28010 [Sphingobacteriaceae bacterium]